MIGESPTRPGTLNGVPLVEHAPASTPDPSIARHADRVVVAPARLVGRKRGARSEETAVLAVAAVDGPERIGTGRRTPPVAALVDRAALAAPALERRAGLGCEKLGARQSLAIGELVGVGPDEHHVGKPLHHAPRDRDGVQVRPQACDASALEGRQHDAPVQAHAARGVGKAAIADAVDVGGEIGPRAGGLDRVEGATRLEVRPAGFIRPKSERPGADDARGGHRWHSAGFPAVVRGMTTRIETPDGLDNHPSGHPDQPARSRGKSHETGHRGGAGVRNGLPFP